MPRRKLAAAEEEWLLEGWKTFGLWLRSRRIAARFTLQQAADAVGVTRRQWIRYEQGAKVPHKRFDRIAEALNFERRQIWYLAGYEVSPKMNDASHLLRRMHKLLLAGDLVTALEEFFLLYSKMRPRKPGANLGIDGTTPVDFANAVIHLEALPTWLFDIVLKCMNKRQDEFDRTGVKKRFRRIILDKCLDELDMTPPIMKGIPYEV